MRNQHIENNKTWLDETPSSFTLNKKRAYTPAEYAAEIWNGAITCKTVRNWIRRRKMPENTKIEITPTGQYKIFIHTGIKSGAVNDLLLMMRAGANK
ncbi:MAG: hypothetical protein Alis3KO_05680 [Aliiglaciecola sp.]